MSVRQPKFHSLSEFCGQLKRYDHFLLSCHVNPEGDAIGSMLAMDSLLRRLGKKTTVVCQDRFPERYLACLRDSRWRQVHHFCKRKRRFDALVLTDCPVPDRIGEVQKLIRPETVVFNIDHHVSNTGFGHFNFVKADAAATAEVVYEIFKGLNLKLTRREATDLYIALSTDTGSFKYSNTTANSHRMAADLIATGINIERINDALHGTISLNKIKLYRRLFRRIRTAAQGSIAWVGMTLKDLKHSRTTYEDAEGFIDFLRYMKEVKIAFFMTEFHRRDSVKVSFRGKGPYDVNRIATHFKGGGHKKASGCLMRSSLENAEKEIVRHIRKIYRLL